MESPSKRGNLRSLTGVDLGCAAAPTAAHCESGYQIRLLTAAVVAQVIDSADLTPPLLGWSTSRRTAGFLKTSSDVDTTEDGHAVALPRPGPSAGKITTYGRSISGAAQEANIAPRPPTASWPHLVAHLALVVAGNTPRSYSE